MEAIAAPSGAPREGRLRRLIRTDALPISADQAGAMVQALLARGSVDAIRTAYVRLVRPMRVDRSAAEALDAHLRGRVRDAAVARAEAVGIDVSELLGTHELLEVWIARTLARCLSHDLPEAADQDLEPLAARVLEALGDAAPAAQRALIAHRSPSNVEFFTRFVPPGADLSAARRAYLDALARWAPGHDPARSVVGYVERWLHGTAEEKRALVDWEAEATASADLDDRRHERRFLRLRCDVALPTSAPDPAPHTFAVLELLRRESSLHESRIAPLDEARDGGAVSPPPAWRPVASGGVAFPVVDAVLVVLGRAALGGAVDSSSLIPRLPPVAVRDIRLPRDPEGLAERLLRELDLVVEPRPLEPAALIALMQRAAAFAPRVPWLASAVADTEDLTPDAPLEAWTSAWARVLRALALWRWKTGFDHIVARLPPARRAGLHDVAAAWLRTPLRGRRPTPRARRPAGVTGTPGIGYNRFDLDPVESPYDQQLVRFTWSNLPQRVELGTWLASEWSDLDRLLTRLGATLDGSVNSTIALHHVLFDDRNLNAFKKAVSIAGRLVWCLVELDEAVEAACPPGVDTAAYRLARAEDVAKLPGSPWPASQLWTGETRDPARLGWP